MKNCYSKRILNEMKVVLFHYMVGSDNISKNLRYVNWTKKE